jgi:hypothetical protein
MEQNLYKWREEANEAVMEELQCPSCKSTERNPAGICNDSWHYWVPRAKAEKKEPLLRMCGCGFIHAANGHCGPF